MVTDGLRRWGWPALCALALAGVVGLAGCRSQSLGGVSEWCDNGVDDDDDGLVDCDDEDCANDPRCDEYQVCGDGVATAWEECDISDMRGMTCADLVPGTSGTLLCSAECTYNTAACGGGVSCNNGIREFGEACDCGTDLATLPLGCTDVNGGANANCDSDCQRIDLCGDGIVSGAEQCDCGVDPGQVPPGCSDVNGAPDGECDEVCEWSNGGCEGDLWDLCDPLGPLSCCPDEWGHATRCASLGSEDFYCLRECSTTVDCFWSNQCWAGLGGICYPAVCGPGYPYDEISSFCEVDGGGPGWCAPVFDRTNPDDDQYGVCVESGTLTHGDACQPHPDLLYQDRTVAGCALGFCLQTANPSVGICRQLCDWEAAYDAAIYGLSGEILPCPAGANCINFARLDATTGVRTGDTSYCLERGSMNHPHSATTCSVITGQLLADPTTLCSEDVPGGRCHVMQLSSGDLTNGTLVGVCSATSAPNRALWEVCDPSTDTCPQGAACRPEDFFAASPAGPTRCLPLCDAQFHTNAGDCAALGAGNPAATCQSLSERFAPTDESPTRLGLCALP